MTDPNKAAVTESNADISDEPIQATKVNAEYWFEAARKEPDRDRAVMHCAQAMYAYKNAAYAFMREITKLRAALDEQSGDLAKLKEFCDARNILARDEWKEAVIDELVVSEILTKEHESNPRKAVADAIHWNIQVALDPAVSSDAQKLVNEGIEAAAKAAHESLRDIDRAHAEIAYSAASALKGVSHD